MSFQQQVAAERDRLTKAREALLQQRQELDAQLASLDTDLKALDAYERVKSGTSPEKKATTTPAERRTGIRDDVLNAVKAGKHKPADIRAHLSIPDTDKQGSQAVANALSALKRAGTITVEQDGTYRYSTAPS